MVEDHFARGRINQSQQHASGSCLAASTLTDERKGAALSDTETHPVNRAYCQTRPPAQRVANWSAHGKVLDQITDLEEWRPSVLHDSHHLGTAGVSTGARS